MEKDFMKIFYNHYEIEIKIAEETYKMRILNYKKEGFNTDYTFDLFRNEKPFQILNNILKSGNISEIEKEFDNRNKVYDKKHTFKAFNEFIIPKFTDVNNDIFKNFEEYIIELARYKAWKKIDYEFSLNIPTYTLMYELNNFKDFSIIGFNGRDNSKMFYKYHKLNYPKEKNFFLYLKKLHDKNIFSFSQEDESIYNLIFNSRRCYDYLILNDYLDVSTSFDDYKNVFLKNFTENASVVKFYCTTIKASVFLNLLRDINEKIDLEKIGITRKFKSKRGNPLKGSTLRQQKRQASDVLIESVENDIQMLKHIARK